MNGKKILVIIMLTILVSVSASLIITKRALSVSYAGDHGNIVAIRLGIVNSFAIMGKDRIVIVDAGEEGNENRIIREIKNRGFDPGQVSLIIVTHGHLDHYGSAGALRRITGAPVAAHKHDSGYMKRGMYAPVVPISIMGAMIKMLFIDENRVIPGVIPDIVIENELDLHKYGIEGKVIPTPGHTAGSVSVVLKNGDCIIGDTIMDYTGPDYAVFAENKEDLKKSVSLSGGGSVPKRIFLSHGGMCDRETVESVLRKDP